MFPSYLPDTNITITSVKIAISYFGVSLDPIIYVFLNRKLRNVAINTITCKDISMCSVELKRERRRKIQDKQIHTRSIYYSRSVSSNKPWIQYVTALWYGHILFDWSQFRWGCLTYKNGHFFHMPPDDVTAQNILGGPFLGRPKICHFQKFITSSKISIFWYVFFLSESCDLGA